MTVPSRGTLKVMFLGPEGTYTHQAAESCFGTSADYIPKPTIADVFSSLSSSTPLAVVPQENSTFGSVAETYDQLRRDEAGQDWRVVGETILAIQHCLFARKGVQLEQIKEVLSHEQALGQCTNFLSGCMKSAARIKTASTAAAVKAISEDGHKHPLSAAIAPKVCGTLFQGVELLQEAIQDEDDNYTSFFVLSRTEIIPMLSAIGPPNTRRALLRLMSAPPSPERSHTADEASETLLCRPRSVSVLPLLNALGPLHLLRIDRRASRYGAAPFHDVYFVLVERTEDGECQVDAWNEDVEAAARNVRDRGGDITILGHW